MLSPDVQADDSSSSLLAFHLARGLCGRRRRLRLVLDAHHDECVGTKIARDGEAGCSVETRLVGAFAGAKLGDAGG